MKSAELKVLPATDLEPATYKTRKKLKPRDEEYEKIKNSIEEFGFADPLVVNADITIIGGHQRLTVAQDLGFIEVPCAVVDVDKTREKAHNIALNKSTGSWDENLLADLLKDIQDSDFDLGFTGFHEGIFQGFIPINHHWINDDPDIYYDISNSINRTKKSRSFNKRAFSAFDLDGYQVVRSQFTQVRYEGPSISISGEKISFNTFCMRRFGSVGYIQLLLHPAERKIAIRPCRQKDIHSIRWRPDPEKRIYSKTISCPHFGSALYSIMGWNPEYTYRVRGVWARRGAEQIIVFNFSNAAPVMLVPGEGERARNKRIELCPEEWADEFGEEFYEHVVDNGFYYLAPGSGWNSQSQSIPAPGIEQYASTSDEELQKKMERLSGRGIGNNGT